jgi:hypothetical protein
VHNAIAWCADTTTPVIDTTLATVEGVGGEVRVGSTTPLAGVLRDPSFLVDCEATRTVNGTLKPDAVPGWVCERDAAVEAALAEGSGPPPASTAAMTVANAAADHLRVWCGGPGGMALPGPTDRFDTFGMWADGNAFQVRVPPPPPPYTHTHTHTQTHTRTHKHTHTHTHTKCACALLSVHALWRLRVVLNRKRRSRPDMIVRWTGPQQHFLHVPCDAFARDWRVACTRDRAVGPSCRRRCNRRARQVLCVHRS